MIFISNLKPLFLAVSSALILTACGENTSSKSGDDFGGNEPVTPIEFDETKLITNIVEQVITPTFEAFEQSSQQQLTAINQYCQLETNYNPDIDDIAPITAAHNAAKTAWQQTMAVWQQAEVMQLGPLIENENELRNRIYSWPAYSYCGIDQDVAYFEDGLVNLNPDNPYDIKKRTATRRGLFAIQRLLYNQNYDHACTTANDALADWNSRTEQSRKVARCQFSVELAKDLVDNSQELLSKWQGDTGFANKLINAGQPGSEFETAHKAVNLISDAMFYTDSVVKDKKIGLPLGKFDNNCGLEICPQDVESLDSQNSLENIKQNLAAFERLFLGNLPGNETQTGFDDFLVEQDASETKDLMIQAIADAKAATNSIDTSLTQALTEQPQRVENTHAQIKQVTDQLKNDFINKLALELPKSSAGDND